MEGSEEMLRRIVDLLVAVGYARAHSPSLSPFDKLTGGLAWCIGACDVDTDLDLFYNDNAALEYKLKIGEAIVAALHKMECPHPLQALQIQGLDCSAVYPVVQWLVKHILGEQVSALEITEKHKLPINAEINSKHEVALLKQITEEEKTKEMLQEQRKDLAAKILKREEIRDNQEKEQSELFLEIKRLEEKVEKAGAGELLKRLLPLLEQSKTSQEEEAFVKSSCEKMHTEFLTSIKSLESKDKRSTVRENNEAEVEIKLQHDIRKLKLLRGDMAKKNQQFILYRQKLDDLPTQSELMQYERCFMELYLLIQSKLQETRKYYATYNAITEANELTLKEISLLNSINAQFEEVMTSQEGRAKFVASMSDIAKGVNQKVERVEARLFAEQNALSALQKKHSQLVAERRRYEKLMKLFQEECVKNELLRSSLLHAA